MSNSTITKKILALMREHYKYPSLCHAVAEDFSADELKEFVGVYENYLGK